MDYSERWKFGEFYNLCMEGYDGLINILAYIFYTNRTNDLSKVTPFFEKYIGSISNINPNIEGGLHKLLEVEVKKILDANESNILILLREMKLKELV